MMQGWPFCNKHDALQQSELISKRDVAGPGNLDHNHIPNNHNHSNKDVPARDISSTLKKCLAVFFEVELLDVVDE